MPPRVWEIRCERCGHTTRKTAKSESAARRHMTRLGWYIYGGNSFCPVCKMMARPNPKRTKLLHEFPELDIREGADRRTSPHALGAKRTADIDDYRTAIGEEYRAVALYNEMIDDADDEAERKTLTHIRDEEMEHLDELKSVSRINPCNNPTVHCPRCEAVVITDFLSKYVIKRGWYMCPQCRYQIKINPPREESLVPFEDHIRVVVDHYLYDEIRNFEEWFYEERLGRFDPWQHVLWHLLALMELVDPAKAKDVRGEIERDLELQPGSLVNYPAESRPFWPMSHSKSNPSHAPERQITLPGHGGSMMIVCGDCGVGIWHDWDKLIDDVYSRYDLRCPECGHLNDCDPAYEPYEP